MNKTPKVSIIIPTYNAEKTIKECISRLISQEFRNFEIIIINDASKDNTLEIIKELNKSNKNIKIINLEKNSGASIARNIGAENANSDTLVFVDSDCMAEKHWLKNITKGIKNKKIAANVSQYNKSCSDSFIAKFAFYELVFRDKEIKEVSSASSCNFSCKKTDFVKVGGFSKDRNTEPAEDMDFFFKISKLGKIKFIEKARVGHYFRDSIKGYLKQQKAYSKSAAYIFLKNYKKEIIKEKTLHKKTTYVEILLTLTLVFLILIEIILFKQFLLITILIYSIIIIIINTTFLIFTSKKENLNFIIKSMPVIITRNIYWTIGLFEGISNYIIYLKNTIYLKPRIVHYKVK